MKRREAIQNIGLLGIGVTLLPACQWQEEGPVYANVPLEKGQRTLLEIVTKALFPTEGTEVQTPESTTDFILTMLNDCASPEDIQKYTRGIKDFQETVKSQFNTSFKQLDASQRKTFFSSIANSETASDNLKHFFNTTAGMSRWHFTSSEYFMKKYRDFEFAPGRYIGCREV